MSKNYEDKCPNNRELWERDGRTAHIDKDERELYDRVQGQYADQVREQRGRSK